MFTPLLGRSHKIIPYSGTIPVFRYNFTTLDLDFVTFNNSQGHVVRQEKDSLNRNIGYLEEQNAREEEDSGINRHIRDTRIASCVALLINDSSVSYHLGLIQICSPAETWVLLTI